MKLLTLAFLSSLLLLNACRQPNDLQFREFKNLRVDDISFNSAKLLVDLVYYNPNNIGMELGKADLEVYVDSVFLGYSRQDLQVRIPRKSEFTIPFKVDLDMKNLLKNGLTSLFKKEVSILIKGKIKAGKAGFMKNFDVNYTTIQSLSFFK